MKLSKLSPSYIRYLFFIKSKGEAYVSEIARQFKTLPSSVIRGLKILERDGFIIMKKIGQYMVCEVI